VGVSKSEEGQERKKLKEVGGSDHRVRCVQPIYGGYSVAGTVGKRRKRSKAKEKGTSNKEPVPI